MRGLVFFFFLSFSVLLCVVPTSEWEQQKIKWTDLRFNECVCVCDVGNDFFFTIASFTRAWKIFLSSTLMAKDMCLSFFFLFICRGWSDRIQPHQGSSASTIPMFALQPLPFCRGPLITTHRSSKQHKHEANDKKTQQQNIVCFLRMEHVCVCVCVSMERCTGLLYKRITHICHPFYSVVIVYPLFYINFIFNVCFSFVHQRWIQNYSASRAHTRTQLVLFFSFFFCCSHALFRVREQKI